MARSIFIKFRTTPAEERRWRGAADSSGMNLSAWLRSLADIAAATGANPADVRAELVALRRDLNAGIGNNVNQIAHAINADLKVGNPASPSEAALRQMADDLTRIRGSIESLMGSRAPTAPRASRRVRNPLQTSPPAEDGRVAITQLPATCQQDSGELSDAETISDSLAHGLGFIDDLLGHITAA